MSRVDKESTHLLTSNDNNRTIDYGSGGHQPHDKDKVGSLLLHKGTIGFLGSLSISVNSLTGPAMLNLPSTYQRSGLIPTCAVIVVTCYLSSECCLHMADSISKLPYNDDFQKNIEFSDVFDYFLGHNGRKRRWFWLTQFLFFTCITCLNISSIVDTSQVVDTFVGNWVTGGSMALHFTSDNVEWIRWDPSTCTPQEVHDGNCVAFGSTSNGILLTLGYIITGLIFLPMSLLDLKENSHFQIMGFLVLLICSIEFLFEFCFVDPDQDGEIGLNFNNISLWGHAWDSLFGVILFNFALVIAIPAWLYEREATVPVPKVIWSSTILSSALYMAVGMAGGWAIPHVSDNMLESMISGVFGITMQISASLFAFMIIGLGIPLFSVLTRLNLTSSDICSHTMGNVLAVGLPWSVSWMLYSGRAITNLLSLGGVFFTSLVAFLLPVGLALYITVSLPEVVGSIYPNNNHHRKTSLIVLFVVVAIAILIALVGLWVGKD